MIVKRADVLNVGGVKYITLESLMYKDGEYVFVNKVDNNEEITEDFYIMRVDGDSAKIVIDENLAGILLPKFQQLLRSDLEKLNEGFK